MDGTDMEVLERMRDNAGAFEAQASSLDDKVSQYASQLYECNLALITLLCCGGR